MSVLSTIIPPESYAESIALPYPVTRKADTVDEYHGTKVPDPYRWLEDDNSAETKAWVQAQNKVTFNYLEQIPERAKIRERLKTLWNYERYGVPFKEGDRYFYTYNSGLQNQRVLMVADTLASEPRVLLDPNSLSSDGTISLTKFSITDDGKLLAYGLARAGSDWEEWHVRDIDTGKDREDLIKWVKFSSASWTKDGSGFYYSRYDEPKQGAQLTGLNEFQKLYFHRIGTPQSDDTLVYERKDHKDWGFNGGVTEDGRCLVIVVNKGTDPKNAIFYKDLKDPNGQVVELLPEFDADYNFVANDGPLFFFSTDLNAPRGKVVAINIEKPARDQWSTIIPEAPEPLKSVSLVNERFLCSYLKDARAAVKVYEHQGDAPAKFNTELKLPGIGSASGFAGKREDKETFFFFTSYTVPGNIYRLNLSSLETELFREPKVDFQPDRYETKQVFFISKDGTRVPMFITHRRGLKLDGSTPTLLYGYGGFNISLSPAFSVQNLAWIESGGIYAVANLRGGGEYGIEWHNGGIKDRKQNVFDDFIGAAEYLIREQYTTPARLGIRGGSNGGLLVGACLTQRPDLFGAAIPAVGVMDMLRFHKFTIGWAWTSDYGSSDNADEFRTLYSYSPLHHMRPGTRYPATLVMTADHDDRVVPAHSFKFAARLQECQAKDGSPVLIRIQTNAGHGGGTALSKLIEESTDELAFLRHQLSGEKADMGN
ncbi:prolyl oligopeptidase family serine peptidase [Verrucomicrobiota bacterium sgz303538]